MVDSGTAGSGTAARLTLLVAGEDGTVPEMPAIRAFWGPVLDGVARFAASERDDSAPGTPIRAVLFDADGVLQLPGEGWMDRMTALAGPDFVRAAFATEPGSDAETKAIATVEQVAKLCARGARLEMTAFGLRSIIATASYRLIAGQDS